MSVFYLLGSGVCSYLNARVQTSALLQLTTGLLGGSLHDYNVATRFDTRKRKLLTTQETLHGQSRFKNQGWQGLMASYTLPWKQLTQATRLLFRAHRRQIILSSRARNNLL